VEQRRLLSETLKQVEWQLFLRTLKRLKAYLVVAGGIITLSGVVSFTAIFSGIRSGVVEAVAVRLAGDTAIKKQVVEDAAMRIEAATNLVRKSQALAASLDKESVRLTATLTFKLDEIHEMLGQIKEDLEDLGAETDGT
jgi:hypothetical protein